MDECRRLLDEKEQIFKDLHIRWDAAIEEKFKREMSEFPNKDPSFVLDRIAHDYLRRGLGIM